VVIGLTRDVWANEIPAASSEPLAHVGGTKVNDSLGFFAG